MNTTCRVRCRCWVATFPQARKGVSILSWMEAGVGTLYFMCAIVLPGSIAAATCVMRADDSFELSINSQAVGSPRRKTSFIKRLRPCSPPACSDR